MNPTRRLIALTSATLALLCLPAVGMAQDKACMLEGGFTFGGKTTEIKDCLQNDGVAAAQFKETCVGLAEFPVSLGEKAAKITYMSACSKPSQGVCEKLFGQAISGHYYKRDAAALADAKQACIAQGGKWK